jgi:hypothetical protein
MPNNRLTCLWCGRPLRPVYERQCVDCHHSMYVHPFGTSQRKTCAQGLAACGCTQPQIETIYSESERREKAILAQNAQFPKVLLGYGQLAGGKFDTQMCGLRWANKYAGAGVK